MATTKRVADIMDIYSEDVLAGWEAYLVEGMKAGKTFEEAMMPKNIGDLLSFRIDSARHYAGAVKVANLVGRNAEAGTVTISTLSVEGISGNYDVIALRLVTEEINAEGVSTWRHAYGLDGKNRDRSEILGYYPTDYRKEAKRGKARTARGRLVVVEGSNAETVATIKAEALAMVAQTIEAVKAGLYGAEVKGEAVELWNITADQPRNLWEGAKAEFILKAKGDGLGISQHRTLQHR